mmetsp:Transcript_13217/g.22632  ORF Transcript_13217/g.22632 Transcript_13217/m.22632 type:complete len:687 (-) Transcript_13217:39-2099(-)
MNTSFICILFACVLFAGSSYQYGILRVEEIWSTENIPQVKIEEMIVEESQIYIDYIEDLSGEGVTVEDVIFSDGSITIPGNFFTHAGVEFESALFSNGGIFADAGENAGFSFTVEDNTGDVFILGDLRIQGGIAASNKFFADGITGDTTINDAILFPNGGIYVNDDRLILDINGEFSTATGDVQVTDDFYFGEFSTTSERFIRRVPSDANGGSTYFVGQSGAATGGDLILEPGDGASVGRIWLGSSRANDLFFGRNSISANDDGGIIEFVGQDSFNGNGGNLFFDGGNSGAVGTGGDIILAPGLSRLDGNAGRMIIGSPKTFEADHDVVVGRPPIVSGTAGQTIYQGQTTDSGIGGSFYLSAGDVLSGVGNPGDLILTPGVDSTGQATVLLGKNTATKLNIRRVPTATSGGATSFHGQNGTAGTGGDVFIRGGASGVSDGGDLYLVPGSSSAGKQGQIVLGVSTDALNVRRPDSTGIAGTTTFAGQTAGDGSGGDLFVVGGDGVTQGGDVIVRGGDGAASLGGDVEIIGGDGTTRGGAIIFRAGNGFLRDGGDIIVSSEDGPVILSARGTVNDGIIHVGPAVNRFYVDEVPVRIENGEIIIRGGSDYVTIANDDDRVVSWNGVPVLKESQVIPVPLADEDPNAITIREDISNLSIDYNNVLEALSQCGHGLVHSVTQPGNILQVCP